MKPCEGARLITYEEVAKRGRGDWPDYRNRIGADEAAPPRSGGYISEKVATATREVVIGPSTGSKSITFTD